MPTTDSNINESKQTGLRRLPISACSPHIVHEDQLKHHNDNYGLLFISTESC